MFDTEEAGRPSFLDRKLGLFHRRISDEGESHQTLAGADAIRDDAVASEELRYTKIPCADTRQRLQTSRRGQQGQLMGAHGDFQDGGWIRLWRFFGEMVLEGRHGIIPNLIAPGTHVD